MLLGNHGDPALVLDEFSIELPSFLQSPSQLFVFFVKTADVLLEYRKPSLYFCLVVGDGSFVAFILLLARLILLPQSICC